MRMFHHPSLGWNRHQFRRLLEIKDFFSQQPWLVPMPNRLLRGWGTILIPIPIPIP